MRRWAILVMGVEGTCDTYWVLYVSDESPIFFLRFYLFIHERHRERGRDTGRRRSRLHAGSPTRDSIPGLQDHDLD